VDDPDIILLSNGLVDVEGNNIREAELMANAFWNSAHSDDPIEHYSYRRGSKYINEYARTRPDNQHRYEGPTDNPNHLLGCYPTLFPYGKGGFEVERPIDVCYEKHIKWALTYHDKRQGCLPAFHTMLMTKWS